MSLEAFTLPVYKLQEYFDAELVLQAKRKEVQFHVSCLRDSYVLVGSDSAYGLCQFGANVEARALDAVEWRDELERVERETKGKRKMLEQALNMLDDRSSRGLKSLYFHNFTELSREEFELAQLQLARYLGNLIKEQLDKQEMEKIG